jgi:hypothetical protein
MYKKYYNERGGDNLPLQKNDLYGADGISQSLG